MSDSITVRVSLDSYDMASTGRQTQVYVRIPEVACVSFLLPGERYHGLVDRAWPEVLDVTNDYVTYGEVATNAAATSAWMAVQGWLRDSANRDEMQAAFEEDRARRNPGAEIVRLRARVAELEAERHSTNEALSDAAEQLRANQDRAAEQAATRAAVLDDFIARCEVALSGCCSECDAATAIVKGRKQAALDSASVPEWSVDKLTRLLAPTQALREDEPATGGA